MEQLNNKWHLPFKILSISIACWLVLPSVFQYGMFMDGMIYSAIAHQMANGNGDLWHLFLSETLFKEFYEHPPFAIFLHSLFYRISDSFIIDKLYSFLTFLLNILGAILIWKNISNPKDKNFWWIPTILYSSILLVSWAFKNNMLENTMSVFCIFSSYFILKACEKRNYFFLLIAALLIVLAFLSKGFTGLFPLGIPFLFFISKANFSFKNFLFVTFILAAFTILLLIPIYLNKNSSSFLSNYFNQQIVKSFEGEKGIDSNRLFILSKIFLELIPVFIISLTILIISYFKKQFIPIPKKTVSSFLLFILIALSASLPVLVSPRQSGYYVLSSFPFFSLAFAELIFPQILIWFNKLNASSKKINTANFIASCILISSILFSVSRYKKYERDEIVLKDIFTICKNIPPKEIVSIPFQQRESWAVYAYFSRCGNISLDIDENKLHRFFLYDPEHQGKIYTNYKKVDLKLSRFVLYVKP